VAVHAERNKGLPPGRGSPRLTRRRADALAAAASPSGPPRHGSPVLGRCSLRRASLARGSMRSAVARKLQVAPRPYRFVLARTRMRVPI